MQLQWLIPVFLTIITLNDISLGFLLAVRLSCSVCLLNLIPCTWNQLLSSSKLNWKPTPPYFHPYVAAIRARCAAMLSAQPMAPARCLPARAHHATGSVLIPAFWKCSHWPDSIFNPDAHEFSIHKFSIQPSMRLRFISWAESNVMIFFSKFTINITLASYVRKEFPFLS